MNARTILLATLSILFQFCNTYSFAQQNFIIAGHHDTTMTYYDYEPDVVVQGNSSFNIDFDNNGEIDFVLGAYHYSALGGNEASLWFSPKNNNRVVLGRVDTIGGYQGPRTRDVAKVQQYGDTINENIGFVKKRTYLATLSYEQGYHFNITDWFGDEKKYLAFELALSDTIVYGWIHVKVTGYNYMEVCEYAFNKNIYLSVDETPDKKLIMLYPNPAHDFINIELNDNNLSEINLLDITGKTVAKKTFYKKTKLDVKGLLNGVYIIKIRTGSKVISRKIIVD